MDEKDEDGVKRTSREATFLRLVMTLDPLLPLPVKSFEDTVASFGSGDEANESSKKSATLQKLVRFVQVIPFLDDWHLVDGEKGIWSTSQEFLGMNAGDYEEHAVLLCSYFHWLDRDEPNYRNYLVVGHAVPEGDGVYVLRQDAYKTPQRSVLWNASTGVGYHVWDERCPMRDVPLAVSSENVYANLQQPHRFRDMTWDIETNSKAWKPFFHPTTIQKDRFALPSVHMRDLKDEETPDEYVNRVEVEIRETLKLEIRRWRSSRFTTTFNIDASMKLRAHLEELEHYMQGQQSPEQSATHRNETNASSTSVLQELQQTKEISGMPLNVTFTDLDKVIDLVNNTASLLLHVVDRVFRIQCLRLLLADLLYRCLISQNIHWSERANAEFALAVYVCGYPNCILSVWVYFVSLVPK